ncbi:MAG: hypothetical protein HC827_14075 [Cyanobacteria bacterium RM1_2_2]|nr:hypothetical protein [Cyanobacteria bacterium RM1_2_2]
MTKSVTEPVTEPGDGIARDPEPSPYESPTLLRELFSLKAVRQSVNIALPPEAELAALPELPLNKMLPGVVGQTDHEMDGRWVDFYQFEGDQDQQVVVMLRNSQDARPTNNLRLTPYAMVFDPNGQVMAATVIPGSYRLSTPDPLLPLDNQLALRLPQSGRYVVAVFTNRGEDGRYGIGWNQDNHRFPYDEIHELANAGFKPPVEITGKANQIVQIHAISYQFDPVVRLIEANGNVIAEDDDNGGNYNSRIEVTLPADGTYQAIVTSADGRQQGQYRLRMR